MKCENIKNFIKTELTVNNTHLNWLIAILLCANVSTSSLDNAKSRERARKRIAVMTANTCIQAEKQHLASKEYATKSTKLSDAWYSEESIKLVDACHLLDQVTKNNFASIFDKKKDNYDLLTYLISNDSNAASRLTSLVTGKNYLYILNTKYGYSFLLKLMERNPDAAIHFTSLITEKNIGNLAFSFYRNFLYKLMEKNPDAALHFTNLVTKNNFGGLTTSINSCYFLCNLIEKNPNAAPHFTPLVTGENHLYILNTEYGYSFLLKLMERNPDAALPRFTSFVTQENFVNMAKRYSHHHANFLIELMEKYPDALRRFTFFVTKNNLTDIVNSFLGDYLTEKIPNYHLTVTKDNFVALIWTNWFLIKLVEKNPTALSHFASLVTAKNWIYLVTTKFGLRILKEKAKTIITPLLDFETLY